MEKKIQFVNAQQMKKEYPDSFYAPAAKDLEALKPGDFVKVCACNERFRAEVLEIDGEKIKARVDNDLIMPDIGYNEVITFQKDHIYNIIQRNKQEPKTSLKKDTGQRKSSKPGL